MLGVWKRTKNTILFIATAFTISVAIAETDYPLSDYRQRGNQDNPQYQEIGKDLARLSAGRPELFRTPKSCAKLRSIGDFALARSKMDSSVRVFEECSVVVNSAFSLAPHQRLCFSESARKELLKALSENWKSYKCHGGTAPSLSSFYLKYYLP